MSRISRLKAVVIAGALLARGFGLPERKENLPTEPRIDDEPITRDPVRQELFYNQAKDRLQRIRANFNYTTRPSFSALRNPDVLPYVVSALQDAASAGYSLGSSFEDVLKIGYRGSLQDFDVGSEILGYTNEQVDALDKKLYDLLLAEEDRERLLGMFFDFKKDIKLHRATWPSILDRMYENPSNLIDPNLLRKDLDSQK